MSPWLALLVPVGLAAFAGLVGWVVRTLVTDRIAALEKALKDSAESQGRRIGDLESWNVAHEAVEKERQRVREDTRGIPTVNEEGKRGRGR